MTDKEKQELISELRKEVQEDLAIYVGMTVLKGIARILGVGLLTLSYYLIKNGYVDL